MSKSQGRRCKAVPKMVELKRKESAVNNEPIEPKVTPIPLKKSSEMYVCSPDIWKKFGIKINLEQNSKITINSEDVKSKSPKLDTAKIKKSLSSKILAKKASQTSEKIKLQSLSPKTTGKTPESPKSFLTIDPCTNNFIVSDEYTEASHSKQSSNSNTDITNALLKLNENKGDQIMEELVNSIITKNCTNPPSKDIIDTIIIPLDDVIDMDNSTSVLNLIETNSSESIPIDNSICFNNISMLNISNDDVILTSDNLIQSTEIIDNSTSTVIPILTMLPEKNQEVVKIDSESLSNSEIIICSDVTASSNESELSTISDILPPEMIESDIMLDKLDLSITNKDNSSTVINELSDKDESNLIMKTKIQSDAKILEKECENLTLNVNRNQNKEQEKESGDLLQNLTDNKTLNVILEKDEPEKVSDVLIPIDTSIEAKEECEVLIQNVTDDETSKVLPDSVNTSEQVQQSSTEVNKIAEYLKQFLNKKNNVPKCRNVLKDNINVETSNQKNDTVKIIDNIGVEEPGGVTESEKPMQSTTVINENISNMYSKVYKKRKSKIDNHNNAVVQKYSYKNFDEAVTTLVMEKNIDKYCYSLDLVSQTCWFGEIRTEMFGDVDDCDVDYNTNDAIQLTDDEINIKGESEDLSKCVSDSVQDMRNTKTKIEPDTSLVYSINNSNITKELGKINIPEEQSETVEKPDCDAANLNMNDNQNISDNVNSENINLMSEEHTKDSEKNNCETLEQVESSEDSQNNFDESLDDLIDVSITTKTCEELERSREANEFEDENNKSLLKIHSNDFMDVSNVTNNNELLDNSQKNSEDDHNNSSAAKEIVIPKKRGRKKKCETIVQVQCEETNLSLDETQNNSEIVEEQIKIPKKRGRKKKCETIVQTVCNESSFTESSQNDIELEKSSTDLMHEEQIKVPKKRGRKKKCDTLEHEQEKTNLTLNNSHNVSEDVIIQNSQELEKSSTDLMQEEQIKLPKKRGRKRKCDIAVTECDDKSLDGSMNSSRTSEDVEVISKKRCKNKKQEDDFIINDYSNSDSESEICENDESKLPKKKGKRKSREEVVANELLFSIASLYDINGTIKPIKPGRKTLDDEIIDENITKALLKVNTLRKCALCFEMVHLKNWPQHNMKFHNLLGWLEGDEPIDLENNKLAGVLLQKVIKIKKKLVCEKCKDTRSSAVGYLSHIKICQRSEEEIEKMKLTCDICKKLVLPQSFKIHMNAHKDKEISMNFIESQNDSKRFKRKAAEVAEKSFKDIKLPEPQQSNAIYKKYYKQSLQYCKNEDDSIIVDSATDRRKLPKYRVYMCLMCDGRMEHKADMIEHINLNHSEEERKAKFPPEDPDYQSSAESEEEYVEPDIENVSRRKLKFKNKNDNATLRNYLLKNDNSPGFNFEESVIYENRKFHKKCGTEFVEKNFCIESLFTNMLCKTYEAISQEEANSYLPKSRQSCNMAYSTYKNNSKKENIKWKKYDLFESDLNNDNITMWCGGSVGGLGWIPGNRATQFLAVSISQSFTERHFANEKYQYGSALQIWKIGSLSNNIAKCCAPASMVYGIAHNHGVVWDMDWCASGCDDDCKNTVKDNVNSVRMGLLAIACSDGNAYIYAVPHPTSLPECESKIYKTTPSMILKLDIDGSKNICAMDYQAVKIFWTRNKGHNIIAVGYSNGVVALFDITLKSILLRQECNGTTTYLPYFSFQPYTAPINGLIILPMNDTGNESDIFLGISSFKGCGVWQKSIALNNLSGHFTNIFLSYPWPSIASLTGKINPKNLSSMLCMIMARSCAKHMQYHGSMLAGGGIGDASFFHNAFLAINDMGDAEVWPVYYPVLKWHKRLLTNSFKQVMISRFKKAVLAMTELKELKQNTSVDDSSSDLLSYDGITKKYGMLFVDVPHLTEYNPIQKRKIEEPFSNRYALQKPMCAKFNPSSEASRFYAVGGRAGQVRIMCVTHLTDNNYSPKKFTKFDTYF